MIKKNFLQYTSLLSFFLVLFCSLNVWSSSLAQKNNSNVIDIPRIDSIVKAGMTAKAFPGCQVLVLRDGKAIYEKSFGYYTYTQKQQVTSATMYDLASLSKTTGTLMAIMKLYDQGRLHLDDKVAHYLAFLRSTDKEDITIRELLFHESGLPPTIFFYRAAIDSTSFHPPFYISKKDTDHTIRVDENTYSCSSFKLKKDYISTKHSDCYPLEVANGMFLTRNFHKEAMKMIATAPLKSKEYRYSCVNFILLKEIAETISGLPLDEVLKKNFYTSMRLKRLDYLPLRTHCKEEVAPTVENDFLRGSLLQGYVHDESAAFFGGISGNAGLFGCARDVARVYQMLLNNGELDGKRYLSKETCQLFTTTNSASGRRALGFDKPTPSDPDRNSCCVSAPFATYGHTGFTGTCCWVDPVNKLIYVFLSNRTFPDVWNNKLSKMNIRTDIQEAIYQKLKLDKKHH